MRFPPNGREYRLKVIKLLIISTVVIANTLIMDNLYQRLTAYNKDFLPDMVKLKYQAMAENIFRFYRGTCHLFYEDLAAAADDLPPSPLTWICGDLHLENFGSYKGDNGLVYFDVNDFDEGVLAPTTWELVRLLGSIFIAFKSLEIGDEKAYKMAQLFLKSYSATLAKGKAISIEPRTAKGIVCDFLTSVAHRKQKQLLHKRTLLKKKKLVLSDKHEKHFKLDKSLRNELGRHIQDWIANSSAGPYNYEVIDAVFRLAGTGSIGVKRYLFLLKSLNTKNTYLLLDMKQSHSATLGPFLKNPQPEWKSDAERIICVQQRMQNVLPALLDTILFRDESYVLQQMQPTEDNINFMLIKDQYRDIYQVIDDMGMLTASCQLRSSGRQGSAIADVLMAFGQNSQWQQDVLEYVFKYTDRIEAYYREYMHGYRNGKYN